MNICSPESMTSLAALRRKIAAMDRAGAPPPASGRVVTGHAGLDGAFGGGLARAQCHELFGAPEEGAAAGLALALAARTAGEGAFLWLRSRAATRIGGLPYGPGLAALGIDPARLLLGVMPDDAMLLRAAVDALRCPALGALILELRGPAPLLDLTASRRLALAAEVSGVTAYLLRIGGDPAPSAAATRWRVAAAASAPLPGDIPGHSAFDLTLLRRRAGSDGQRWRLTWNAERRIFGDAPHECDDARPQPDAAGQAGPPLFGAMAPLPADRSAADRAA